MEVSATLEALQAEVRCPVCLDFLTDPVTIPCGHNFCRSCIQQCWKDLPGRFPCPVCRHPQQERHFSPNSQLARMIDLAKLLHSSSQSRQQENTLCGQHNQVLGLFCEDDLEVVCGLCTSAHQGHLVRPMEEAASYHRQRLRSYREALKRQVADVQKLITTQDKKLVELREQAALRRWKLASEFEHLSQFVEHEQEAAMSKLAEEERDIQQKLSENVNTFTEYISTVKGLLREVAERSVMSEVKLLRGVKSLQDREKPRGIGVYLDYELGQISFYSVHDWSHIHTFRETFSQVLKPYLCVGRDPEPLTVGAGGEHAG
ncbi:PREDICTED: putative tripartite motif-containing protein 75 [Condylura cristata]|uniref:putative tripartite motif-containing protein 75 n=1 Tax=Condylura cristata TaxID=143302 RepID=UPI0003345166|nr:PREDICTED: putative tripartite motif-containing protein 75 [Condylura cristata]